MEVTTATFISSLDIIYDNGPFHSFIYYAFIKSIQGLAPTGYRTQARDSPNTLKKLIVYNICAC